MGGLVSREFGWGTKNSSLLYKNFKIYFSRPESAWGVVNKVTTPTNSMKNEEADAYKCACFIQVFIKHLLI